MHRVFLIIGGNLGDRELYLRQTVSQIKEKVGAIISSSDIYESEPWGFTHSIPFLNQVLEIETNLAALCLLDACQLIETNLGRNRYSENYSARTADIDVLLYDDCIFTLPPLIVPHRLMHERKFVLEPLSQIAPNLIHPLLGLTISQLKSNCEDKSEVWRYKSVRELVNG
ncbi:MAG: 2-amino-4-hydroxy-6-hydroxymethyldihydropteridine diphosphokinase [Bacteroidetes bacterium HGW-Bacteroidetes-15]|nr:MAG: 2-amino-4-hydroxy-6-hydroxymethyldihydropteridine diphosphokinase [Bacteroidetes bacterium HGW-Bacteroidetes-15]